MNMLSAVYLIVIIGTLSFFSIFIFEEYSEGEELEEECREQCLLNDYNYYSSALNWGNNMCKCKDLDGKIIQLYG